ncbi:MAG: A/G-specific adenine glycosylase [Acidobacteriota bacterium]|nr:A/G-specific adenine glycosylase [Acidobacteriota bacterium]
MPAPAFRRALLDWYRAHRRELPWRQDTGLYRVWVSEIMLQQTRVEAVVPYFERFLARFPDLQSLAEAPEPEVLALWSGLGYYSRARNLHRAARQVAASGVPGSYEEIAALPGVGPYTAAAIASIALDLPHAAVDGNVVRVMARLTNDGSEVSSPRVRTKLGEEAQHLLDPRHPGDFNQAMMELGATVCRPRQPHCLFCPVREFCAGRAAGRERELPVKRGKPAATDVPLDLVIFERGESVFLVPRATTERRLAGFWELPAKGLVKAVTESVFRFTHRIVNDRFLVEVWRAKRIPGNLPDAGKWVDRNDLRRLPVTTVTRKAVLARSRKGAQPAMES